jgi:hypothetical protein
MEKKEMLVEYKKEVERWMREQGEEGLSTHEKNLRTSFKQDPELQSIFEDADGSSEAEALLPNEDDSFQKFFDVCASIQGMTDLDYPKACNQFLQVLQVSQKVAKEPVSPTLRPAARKIYRSEVLVRDKPWKQLVIKSYGKKPLPIIAQIEIIKFLSPLVYGHLLKEIERNPFPLDTHREDSQKFEDPESSTGYSSENYSDITSENVYRVYFKIEIAEENWSEVGLSEMRKTKEEFRGINAKNHYNEDIKDRKTGLAEAFKTKHKRLNKSTDLFVSHHETDQSVEIKVEVRKSTGTSDKICLLSLKYKYPNIKKPNYQEVLGFLLYQKFAPETFEYILESVKNRTYQLRPSSRTPTASVRGRGDSVSSRISQTPEEVEEINRQFGQLASRRANNLAVGGTTAYPDYQRNWKNEERNDPSGLTSEIGSPGLHPMRRSAHQIAPLQFPNTSFAPKQSTYFTTESTSQSHNRHAFGAMERTSPYASSRQIPVSGPSEMRSSQYLPKNLKETDTHRPIRRPSEIISVPANNSAQPVKASPKIRESVLWRNLREKNEAEDFIEIFKEFCVPNIKEVLNALRFDLRKESHSIGFQFPVLWDDQKFIEISQSVFKKQQLFLNLLKFDMTNRMVFGATKEGKRKIYGYIEWEDKSPCEFIQFAKVAILLIIEALAPKCLSRLCSDSIRRKLELRQMSPLEPKVLMADYVKRQQIDFSIVKVVRILKPFIEQWRKENKPKVDLLDRRSFSTSGQGSKNTLELLERMASSCGIQLSIEMRDKRVGLHRVWRTVLLQGRSMIKIEFLDVQATVDSPQARARIDALTGLLLIRVLMKSCLVHPSDSDLIVSAILKHFK